MKAWISKNWLQSLTIFFSLGLAMGITFDPSHATVYAGIWSALSLLGIRLMPLTLQGAPGDSPAPLVIPSANPAKPDAAAVIALIEEAASAASSNNQSILAAAAPKEAETLPKLPDVKP